MRLSNVVTVSVAGVCALSAGLAWMGGSNLFSPQNQRPIMREAAFANDSLARRFVQQMVSEGTEEWNRWHGFVIERPVPFPAEGLSRSLLYPVKVNGLQKGYVAVGSAPDKPVIQAFTSDVSLNIAPYLSTVLAPSRKSESVASRAIPNFPLLEKAHSANALLGGLVVFWSGHSPALSRAIRAQEQVSIPVSSRIETSQWVMNQIQQAASLGQRKLQVDRLSKEHATAPLFNDYRIEIDQGRPVLVILFPTKEGSSSSVTEPLIAVGTGYLINQEGRFLALSVMEERAQSTGRIYVRWESAQPNIDLIRVKPIQ